MKVGIVANIMQDKTLAEALDYFRKTPETVRIQNSPIG